MASRVSSTQTMLACALQPAVCDRYRAFSVYDAVRQRRHCLLHYTNFIEVGCQGCQQGFQWGAMFA